MTPGRTEPRQAELGQGGHKGAELPHALFQGGGVVVRQLPDDGLPAGRRGARVRPFHAAEYANNPEVAVNF